ncbi:MAG: hypothetical protein LBQ78_06820 [Tannerellaceae bacterium]|jgi:hypothetical protein|nr:hypothetical protein [Tannerellaceae bacterium]
MSKKKYAIKFLCLLGVFILSDLIIGTGLQHLYFRQKQGRLYNLTHALEQQTADILILGSSRARSHYNPAIISDSLHMSCFNAGYDAQGILYHKALLDVIIGRHTPKVIILDVNTFELDVDEQANNLLSALNPYVKRHPILWKTVAMKSPFEKIKHLSRIYPYNSLFARIVLGYLHFSRYDVHANGFTTLKGICHDSLKEVIYKEAILDENRRNAFDQFLSDCTLRGITVYVVKSPLFGYEKNSSNSMNYIIATCEKRRIPFISYQNRDDFADNHLFKDLKHLNDIGADKFSSDFAHLIKSGDF